MHTPLHLESVSFRDYSIVFLNTFVIFRDIYEKALNTLKEAGEDTDDALLHIYRFTKRRMAYALINNGDLEEAKAMLEDMLKNGEDVEFAKIELEYIKKQKGEECQ